MWFVPNQFKCIKDEDNRLKHISENLLTRSGQEFLAPSLQPVNVWLNNQHQWVKFINAADDLDEYIQSISKSGLSLEHETQSVIPDKYEDLPFLSIGTLKGNYIYISVKEWDQDTKLESLKSVKRKLWPTPLASDWHFHRMNKPLSKTAWGGVESRNVNCLPVCVHWDAQLYKTHQANPRWFEQMMGLPMGWTDPYL